jgi:hypothetical protein
MLAPTDGGAAGRDVVTGACNMVSDIVNYNTIREWITGIALSSR